MNVYVDIKPKNCFECPFYDAGIYTHTCHIGGTLGKNGQPRQCPLSVHDTRMEEKLKESNKLIDYLSKQLKRKEKEKNHE